MCKAPVLYSKRNNERKEKQMKKRILLIIIAIAMLVLLCSCSGMDKVEKKTATNYGTRFKTIEEYGCGYIVVDTHTNVEYWLSYSSYNSGNLTLLVDANGDPSIFEED